MSLEIVGNVSVGGGWLGAILKNSSDKEITIVMISHTNNDGIYSYPYDGPTSISPGTIRVILQECMQGSVDCQIKTDANTIKFHYDHDATTEKKGDKKDVAFVVSQKLSDLFADPAQDGNKAELANAFIELAKMF